MNILLISNMFPNSKFPTNGIFVSEQVKALRDLGISLTVISPIPYVFPFLKLFNDKWKNYTSIKAVEEFEGIKVYRPRFIAIPGGRVKQYWHFVLYLTSRKLIKKLHSNKKFDLIHIQGSAPDDYTGLKLSKLLKIPYILTIHGDSVLALAKNKKRFKSTKIAIEKADAVIAVSSKVKKKILELTNRTENIFVVHNGYSKVSELENLEDKKQQFLTILFVGNLIPQKGCENLIMALSKVITRFHNVKLKIVGNGPELPDLKQLVQKLELNKVVTFYGRQPHDEVLKFMQTCDIFVLPSIKEALGVVYLEAMSFKKPVIGSLGEGIEDIIKERQNGLLVNPKDINSIVEKIELLIVDENLRIKLGKMGFETIKNLTWESNARKNIKIYVKVLNKINK